MNLQIEFWQLVWLAITLAFGTLGAFVAIGKVLAQPGPETHRHEL